MFRKPVLRWGGALCAAILALAALGCASKVEQGASFDLVVLATSDVHNNYMDYDYFTDRATDRTGLVRLASEIGRFRAENPNVLLVDNGDLIQGNPFGEYLYKNPPEGTSPIMALMNAMGYDAMTLGNHEFNFGLPYLEKTIKGAKFPVVCANVVKAGTQEPYFTPYVIKPYTFAGEDGKKLKIRVGFLGLVTPQIMTWDADKLRGKVDTIDGYDAAAKYVPEMKAKGADIVVVLAHSGLAAFDRRGGEENFAAYVTAVPGVDVVISGHSHNQFPSGGYAKVANVDIERGTINSVPVVMPGSFADNLGVIQARFTYTASGWDLAEGFGRLVPVYNAQDKTSLPAVAELVEILRPAHERVVAFIRAPVGAGEDGAAAGGSVSAPLNSFFALVHDDFSVQLVNEAQMWYAKTALANTEYAALPILSAAAPFKCGGRQGPAYYTDIPAGPLAIKNMADLYVYTNSIVILKLTGAEIREWLEMSAGQFNQIKAGPAEQNLINDAFPTYLFDVIDGVTYEIDVSQPARYNREGALVDSAAHRIRNLAWQGKPLDDGQSFALVSNNYRANGGGNFPNADPDHQIYASPDENRQAVLQYIESLGVVNPAPNANWKLDIPAGASDVVFVSSPKAKDALIPGVSFVALNADGFGVYRVDPSALK